MKKSKINWIEYIPNNWEEKPLKSLLLESKKKNTNIETKNILSVTKDRGVIPYEEKGQIGNNKSEDIGRYKLVKKNDLVINKMNIVIGSLGISRYSGALSQVYLVYRPKIELDIRYYEYVFRNPKFYKYTKKYTTGIMELRESLNDLYFKNTYLPVPPQNEQIKIANFLDDKINRIDTKINKLINENKYLQEFEKNLKIKLLNGKNEEMIKLKNVIEIKNGREIITNKGTIPVYGSGGIFKYTNSSIFNGEAILFGRKGTIGKPMMVEGEFWTVDTMFYAIKKNNSNLKFLKKTLDVMDWGKITTKTAIPSVTSADIKEQKIYFPTIKKQIKLLNKINKVEYQVKLLSEQNKKKLELLEEYKKVLINDAVTGKIDIGDEYGK